MTRVRNQGLAVLVGLLLSIVQAQPSIAAPAWLAGKDYTFGSFAVDRNGYAVCNEHWHFGADDIKTITHGKQVLRMKYRIERDGGDLYLVEEKVDPMQADDCLSSMRADPAGPRRYLFVGVLENGSFFLVRHKKDPTKNEPMLLPDLYGRADLEHPTKLN